MSAFALKALFYYSGPTLARPGGVCEYLPITQLAIYETCGHFIVGWLFWNFEINWKRQP